MKEKSAEVRSLSQLLRRCIIAKSWYEAAFATMIMYSTPSHNLTVTWSDFLLDWLMSHIYICTEERERAQSRKPITWPLNNERAYCSSISLDYVTSVTRETKVYKMDELLRVRWSVMHWPKRYTSNVKDEILMTMFFFYCYRCGRSEDASLLHVRFEIAHKFFCTFLSMCRPSVLSAVWKSFYWFRWIADLVTSKC